MISPGKLGGDPCKAYHAEFIQIAAGDGNEIQAFQQGIARILCFIQHSGIEFDPADIPVDESVHILFCFFFHIPVHPSLLCKKEFAGIDTAEIGPVGFWYRFGKETGIVSRKKCDGIFSCFDLQSFRTGSQKGKGAGDPQQRG